MSTNQDLDLTIQINKKCSLIQINKKKLFPMVVQIFQSYKCMEVGDYIQYSKLNTNT